MNPGTATITHSVGTAHRPWTRIEERRATAMRLGGMTYRAIAAALNRTPGAINRKCVLLGIRSRQRRKGELRAAVKKLSGRGLFDWEVAIRLDITTSQVARVRRRLGIPATDAAQSARAKQRRKTV